MTGIVFQVETSRILALLATEIYDSPLALLRENVQNAYDAVRMRFAEDGKLTDGGRIEVLLEGPILTILDNGIGMDETGLRENYWKAGSSGKRSDAAKRAGVVGTFGIGAMANFGVCDELTIETNSVENGSSFLRSFARREELQIGADCIQLKTIDGLKPQGTTVTAHLDPANQISVAQAEEYLLPYVGSLKVPVFLNGKLISQKTVGERLEMGTRPFAVLETRNGSSGQFECSVSTSVDANGQLLVVVGDVVFGGQRIDGELHLLQGGGQLMGLRSDFGLAPIPVGGAYEFGGLANLAFLQPTAGREAVSRESIQAVSDLVSIAERLASESLAKNALADRNNAFLQWTVSHGRADLMTQVLISVLPMREDVKLGQVRELAAGKKILYYTGSDSQILSTFSSEESLLAHVSQSNPRRQAQINYLTTILQIASVPTSAQVTKIYRGPELGIREASVLVRTASILREDYLISDVDVVFADISHGVIVLPTMENGRLTVHISRSSAVIPPLLEFYNGAYELFSQFMKDFVRVQVYPRVQQYVPSSTRDGVEALKKVLQRNRELYSYEETDQGTLEGILGEYLSGASTFGQVLQEAVARAKPQTQNVTADQVGSVESAIPGIEQSPVAVQQSDGSEFGPSPPILRDGTPTDMKILVASGKYPVLNEFQMFLGLSDRLMRTETDFFLAAHTTRVLWGGHRVVYIFTEATGRLSLYYDIELKQQIEHAKAGGGMFRTTTLITKNRIFIPVPEALQEEFRVATGSKRFYVRYDILSSE